MHCQLWDKLSKSHEEINFDDDFIWIQKITCTLLDYKKDCQVQRERTLIPSQSYTNV